MLPREQERAPRTGKFHVHGIPFQAAGSNGGPPQCFEANVPEGATLDQVQGKFAARFKLVWDRGNARSDRAC